jgi:hypothetical protein
VEPGAFCTGRVAFPPAEVTPDYERTVGRMHAFRRNAEGHQPGDPARAARVLVDVVGHEHPPLRLLLGSDALHAAERSSRARAQEAAVWADVSRSTDAAGAGDGGLAAVLHLMVPVAS